MKNLLFIVLFIHISISTTQAQNVYPFSFGGKYGLINSNYEIILKPKYFSIDFFPSQWDNDYAIFSQTNYGLLDKKGEVIIPAKYHFLIYDGNKRFAFSKPRTNSVEVIDIYYRNVIHRQKFTKIDSKGGLVVIKSNNPDATTILLHNNTVKSFNGGSVSIVQVDTNFYYKHSELEKHTYYNALGEKIAAQVEDNVMYGARTVQGDPNAKIKPENWDGLVEKFGVKNLEPISEFDKKVSAIYHNPKDGSYKLLDLDGNTLFEYKGMTRLSSYNNSKMPYLEFNVGKYYGLISKSGRLILKPEFLDYLRKPSKYNDNVYFVVHKSGYGGVLDDDEKLYLPKESGYVGE